LRKNINTALQEELKQLRLDYKKSRFWTIRPTGVNGTVFVGTSKAVDPVDLESKMLEELFTLGYRRGKHIIRMIPVQLICPAKTETLKEMSKSLIEPIFNAPDQKNEKLYDIIVTMRNAAGVHSKDIKRELITLIHQTNFNEFENPEWLINIEVLRGSACISVCQWKKLWKFNLIHMYSIVVAPKLKPWKEEIKKRKKARKELGIKTPQIPKNKSVKDNVADYMRKKRAEMEALALTSSDSSSDSEMEVEKTKKRKVRSKKETDSEEEKSASDQSEEEKTKKKKVRSKKEKDSEEEKSASDQSDEEE